MRGNGKFIFNNATITDCVGYAAMVPTGGLFISGEVNITGNHGGANGNGNLYIKTGKIITVTGDLGASQIGVTTQTSPTADAPIVLTTGLSGYGDASNFFSDNPAYTVRTNADGEAILVVPPAAEVDGTGCASFADAVTAWNSAASGATLTLFDDAETASTITVSGTKTLDLNGHGIKMTGGHIINVRSGAVLTLNDSDTDAEHRFTVSDHLAAVDDTLTGTEGMRNGAKSFVQNTVVMVGGGAAVLANTTMPQLKEMFPILDVNALVDPPAMVETVDSGNAAAEQDEPTQGDVNDEASESSTGEPTDAEPDGETSDGEDGETDAAADGAASNGVETPDTPAAPEETPAGCTTAGSRAYTATVEEDGQTFTDTRTETIPATGHSFGEAHITKDENGNDKLTFHCEGCNQDFIIEFGITKEN